MNNDFSEYSLERYLGELLSLFDKSMRSFKSEVELLTDDDFFYWRSCRLLFKNYPNVFKFSEDNIINYSLKNIVLLIMKTFSNKGEDKLEALKEDLVDFDSVRNDNVSDKEPSEVESIESGEIDIPVKETKSKEVPKKQEKKAEKSRVKKRVYERKDNNRNQRKESKNK